ncbi:MAG: hypothetical protein CBB71_10905, partial [Rhodopirellula sp. TMED11]
MQAEVSRVDTPTNRKVWLDLERLFVEELISPSIELGVTPEKVGATASPDAQVITMEADLRSHHSEAPQLVSESPDGPAPWDVVDSEVDDTVETLLARWLESIRKTATARRAENADKSV